MYLGVRNRALYTMYTNWIGGKVLHSGPVLVLMLRGPLAHAAYSTRAVVILLLLPVLRVARWPDCKRGDRAAIHRLAPPRAGCDAVRYCMLLLRPEGAAAWLTAGVMEAGLVGV